MRSFLYGALAVAFLAFAGGNPAWADEPTQPGQAEVRVMNWVPSQSNAQIQEVRLGGRGGYDRGYGGFYGGGLYRGGIYGGYGYPYYGGYYGGGYAYPYYGGYGGFASPYYGYSYPYYAGSYYTPYYGTNYYYGY